MKRNKSSRRRSFTAAASAAVRPIIEALEDRTLLSTNPIVAENALPGTPQSVWQVNGNGDTTIQGFTTDISYDIGQTVQFKIDDSSLSTYQINIYRLGYYQGDGARLIGTVASSQTKAVDQPNPLTDASTGLVDCGNWSVTASFAIPATAVSGVYIANVVKSNGGTTQIPFVVRNDASHSDILFQTDDTTWEAYNQWGGSSLYLGDGPGTGSAPRHAYAVSYNRPFATRGQSTGYGPSNYVFWAEFPTIEFLEQNGYDVSYQSAVDADRYPSELLNHKVWMDAGHDEYWTIGEFQAVQAARNAGVDLMFLSGNEVSWECRWQNSMDGSNTPDRTLVCYKESLVDAQIDPLAGAWTGEFQDLRFSPPEDGGPPQNSLTGQLWDVNRGPNDTGTAITVPYGDSLDRLWRNTPVASLTVGETEDIGTEVLGYEWDEDVDNGYRPAGEINMSSTTQAVTQKTLDLNDDVGPGIATHSLTLYRAASGAPVFGAGTVQWAWGLNANHDGDAVPVDSVIQQATINMLADMGAQPLTLMAGMIAAAGSTDHTPPISAITMPPNDTIVENNGFATITGTASDVGGVVAGVEVSVDGGTTWHPATGKNAWTYSFAVNSSAPITVISRATDDSANVETPTDKVTINASAGNGDLALFSDATIPPVITTDDAGAFELGVKIYTDVPGSITGVRFYKGPANSGVHTGSLWSSTGTLLATGTFTNETDTGWQTLTFATPVTVTANTVYVASYHTTVGEYSSSSEFFDGNSINHGSLHAPADGVDGPNGVYVQGNSAFPTQTYQAGNYYVDVVFSPSVSQGNTPVVVAQTPLAGSTGDAVNTSVTAQFNESVLSSSIGFTLTDALGNSVAGLLTYNDSTHTATFTPTAILQSNTTYSAKVSGATDASGDVMTAPAIWTFTTGAINLFGSKIPSTQSANDNQPIEVGVRFDSDVPGYVTGIRFYKGSQNTGTHIGNLWTNTGTLLATATFTNESASGWQTVTFSQPVAVTAGTVYVASYHTNAGFYAADADYFGESGVAVGPLHAPVDGVSGPNGVYLYGATSAFPTQDGDGTNYWVDVNFLTGPSAPFVTGVSPVPGAAGVAVTSAVTITFAAPIDPSSVNTSTVQLLDGNNSPVAASVAYNPTNFTATLIPTASLANGATYTVVVHGGSTDPRIKDLNGNALANTYSSQFSTVAIATGPFSLFPTTLPTVTTDTDPNSVELGVRFQSSQSGVITGIRFYKGAQNTGAHTGSLWDSNGNLLATVTFSNETASGWQTANFSTPVAISANTVYTASYHTKGGHYSDTPGFFTGGALVSGPLTAPADGAGSSNGVYLYGSGGFPSQDGAGANYFVDVVFVPGAAPGLAIAAVTPTTGATGVTSTTVVSVTFSKPVDPTTITTTTFQLLDASSNPVAGTVAYNSSTNTATFTPAVALLASTTYTIVLHGGAIAPQVKDTSGNPLAATFTSTFVTAAPVNSGSIDLFGATTPTVITEDDPNAVELGVKIESDVPGVITGVRFYKGPQNTGVHVGNLWDSNGNLLATVTFSGETASGWQQATFSTPVQISANTLYTASYHTSTGFYSADAGYFATAGANSGTLHALSNAASSGNGVYLYGAGGFPTNSYNASNYWVDVLFTAVVAAPTITAQSPAPGATNVATSVSPTVTFSETLNPATVTSSTVQLLNGSTAISATVSYSGTTVTITPAAALTAGTVYTISIKGGAGGIADPSGDVLAATATWTFTTAIATTIPTVANQTPANGATNIGTNVAPTITFSEAMNPSTITTSTVELLTSTKAVVASTITYNAASNTATITPKSALSASATYTITVIGGASGVKDASGNALAANFTSTFTTNGPWTQSTPSGFNGGVAGAGVSASSTGVQLAFPFDDEFPGTALSTLWNKASLGSSSSVTVTGGNATIRQSSLTSKTTFSSPSVEASLSVLKAPNQIFGVSAGSGGLTAEFTTSTSSSTLSAVVTVSGTTRTVSLGAIKTGFHVYRVQPVSGGVKFLIDGTTVTTVPLAFPTTPLNVVLSDSNAAANQAMQANYVHVLYPAGGTFTSSVFDATRQATWGKAAWTATLPVGTTLTVMTRSGNTASPDGTWSAWTAVSNGGTVASPAGRYLQYEVVLATTDPGQTPLLTSISFQWT